MLADAGGSGGAERIVPGNRGLLIVMAQGGNIDLGPCLRGEGRVGESGGVAGLAGRGAGGLLCPGCRGGHGLSLHAAAVGAGAGLPGRTGPARILLGPAVFHTAEAVAAGAAPGGDDHLTGGIALRVSDAPGLAQREIQLLGVGRNCDDVFGGVIFHGLAVVLGTHIGHEAGVAALADEAAALDPGGGNVVGGVGRVHPDPDLPAAIHRSAPDGQVCAVVGTDAGRFSVGLGAARLEAQGAARAGAAEAEVGALQNEIPGDPQNGIFAVHTPVGLRRELRAAAEGEVHFPSIDQTVVGFSLDIVGGELMEGQNPLVGVVGVGRENGFAVAEDVVFVFGGDLGGAEPEIVACGALREGGEGEEAEEEAAQEQQGRETSCKLFHVGSSFLDFFGTRRPVRPPELFSMA